MIRASAKTYRRRSGCYISALLILFLIFSNLETDAGWFSDENPEDCYNSKISKCDSLPCRHAVRIGCDRKFSKDKLEEDIGRCIIRESNNIVGNYGVRATVQGCIWNERCGSAGQGGVGICLLESLDEIYNARDYKFNLRKCLRNKDRVRNAYGLDKAEGDCR